MNEFNSGEFKSEEEQAARDFEQESKPSGTKIFLARHGESEHNIAVPGYFAGGSKEYDTPLTPKGEESAKKVAEKLREEGIDLLVHSDLKRSRETAEVINRELGGKIELVEIGGLKEVQVGELTGKTREQVVNEGSEAARKALEVFASGDVQQINFPGGDTFETASQRVRESLDKIIKEHGDKTKIAVIGHGNINKVMLSLMFPDEADFIRQLNLAHENVVELDMETDKEGNVEFKNVKLHGEAKDEGLI